MSSPEPPNRRTTTIRELVDLYRRYAVEKLFILAMIIMFLMWFWYAT